LKKALLCLDIEGTLVSNAISQIPRPGLYQFLERVAELFDLMIYTSVSFERVDAIRDLLVAESSVPEWFGDLPVIRPEKTLKPKSACGRNDAFILDDQEEVIAAGEKDWWVPISEFLPPYSESDRALDDAFNRLRALV
jgi:hypothetical protein